MAARKLPKMNWKRMLLTLVLAFLELLILGFLFFPKPILAIPKPTGKNPMGFTSLVIVDDSKKISNNAARALTLDIWYPATHG
jgi:hypothetical protein